MSVEVDLNRLQIFKTVAQLGSFSKAASQLKQPKSRISRNIAALEKEMGVQLIYRTTRQFQLTNAGQSLFKRSFPLLSELKNTLDLVSQSSNEIKGPIKLTVPEDIGTALMGPLLYEFMQTYPKVDLTLFTSNEYEDLLPSSFDMALRIGKIKDSTMIQKNVGRVSLGLYAHPDLLKGLDPDNTNDILTLPYLAFIPKGQDFKGLKVFNGKKQKTLKINPSFISNNFFALKSIALKAGGVVMLPRFIAQEQVLTGQLTSVLKDWKTEPVEIQILIPGQKETPQRIQHLMNFLSQRLKAFI